MPSEAFLRRMRTHELAGAAVEPVEVRERLAAVLLRSGRFGEVWLALDRCVLPELAAEEATREEPRPVLLSDDVIRLRGKSDDAIRAALEVWRAFPGSRLQ